MSGMAVVTAAHSGAIIFRSWESVEFVWKQAIEMNKDIATDYTNRLHAPDSEEWEDLWFTKFHDMMENTQVNGKYHEHYTPTPKGVFYLGRVA